MQQGKGILSFNNCNFVTNTEAAITALFQRRTTVLGMLVGCDAMPALPCLEIEFQQIVEHAARALFSGKHAQINNGMLQLGQDATNDFPSTHCYSVANLTQMLPDFLVAQALPRHVYTTVSDIQEQVQDVALLESVIVDATDLIGYPRVDRSAQAICAFDMGYVQGSSSMFEACLELLQPHAFEALAFLCSALLTILRDAVSVYVSEVRIMHAGFDASPRDIHIVICLPDKVAVAAADAKVASLFGGCSVGAAEGVLEAIIDRLTNTCTDVGVAAPYYAVSDVYGKSLNINSTIREFNLDSLRFVQVHVIALSVESDVAMYASTTDTLGKFIPVNG